MSYEVPDNISNDIAFSACQAMVRLLKRYDPDLQAEYDQILECTNTPESIGTSAFSVIWSEGMYRVGGKLIDEMREVGLKVFNRALFADIEKSSALQTDEIDAGAHEGT